MKLKLFLTSAVSQSSLSLQHLLHLQHTVHLGSKQRLAPLLGLTHNLFHK